MGHRAFRTKIWKHCKHCEVDFKNAWFGIVPQYSLQSSLMLYLVDGRIMLVGGLIREYFSTNVKIRLCMEKLSLVLPETPPYVPRQFACCAVIGNSGDLLKTRFGKEIDGYDAVVRENGAPIQNFTEYVGEKSTFRLLNRGSAEALDKVAELYETGKEVLVVKTTIHDIMSKMIREIPILNPVYLMLGASFGSAAKGTGLKALEFALSICDTVNMYGFTVDPGYKEWTRYFSESRQGHTPLQGRAYYQMMECLGLGTY